MYLTVYILKLWEEAITEMSELEMNISSRQSYVRLPVGLSWFPLLLAPE